MKLQKTRTILIVFVSAFGLIIVAVIILISFRKEGNLCDKEYGKLEKEWEALTQSPTESKKSSFERCLKTTEVVCEGVSDKPLLKENAAQKKVQELFDSRKQELLNEPLSVSKQAALDNAIALVRLYDENFESKDALNLVYDHMESLVTTAYNTFLASPSKTKASDLKRDWAIGKELASRAGKNVQLYLFDSLAEYVARSIPDYLENINQPESEQKLQTHFSALKTIDSEHRYAQLLQTEEQISFAGEYMRKMMQHEEQLVNSFKSYDAALLAQSPVLDEIRTIRGTLTNDLDLSRFNLPPNPTNPQILTQALKVDRFRDAVQGILKSVAYEAFAVAPDLNVQEKIGKFISDLQASYSFSFSAPELSAWKDVKSVRLSYVELLLNDFVQDVKGNPSISDEELLSRHNTWKDKVTELDIDNVVPEDHLAAKISSLASPAEIREELIMAGMDEEEKRDYKLGKLGW